jgi:DeoR/GlpR family transcriptional regulator of sugar metabolism
MTKIQRNPAQRQGEIKRLLLARGALSVEELCSLVSASPATIRRDLAYLQDSLGIERTHGGAAVQALRPAEQNFAAREAQDVEEKRAIAEAVLTLIEPGSTIFMNDGSSIMAVAKAIVAVGIEVFVATPAVNVSTTLSENPKATVCLLGGFVRQTSLATSGPFAEAMVAQINADLALISPDGLSADGGLTFTYASDAVLARCMSDKARRTVAIAVGAKLGRTERIGALPLSSVGEIITGCTDAILLQGLRERGVKVTEVDADAGGARA